jgi:hypothetical protein
MGSALEIGQEWRNQKNNLDPIVIQSEYKNRPQSDNWIIEHQDQRPDPLKESALNLFHHFLIVEWWLKQMNKPLPYLVVDFC